MSEFVISNWQQLRKIHMRNNQNGKLTNKGYEKLWDFLSDRASYSGDGQLRYDSEWEFSGWYQATLTKDDYEELSRDNSNIIHIHSNKYVLEAY